MGPKLSLHRFVEDLAPQFLRPYWRRLVGSHLGYRLFRGGFWSLVGGGGIRVLNLLVYILVARILGQKAYGQLGAIQSTIVMFTVFANFGIGVTSTKYIAEYRLSDPPRARRIITLSFKVAWITSSLVFLLLLIFAPWVARRTMASAKLGGPLQIASLVLLLIGINGAQTGVLSGLEAFKELAFVNLLAGVISLPLVLGCTYWKGLEGTVWGLAFSNLTICCLMHLARRREEARAGIPPKGGGWKQELPILWEFSLPHLLATFMVGPVIWACYAILANQKGGYPQIGLFTAANQWRQAIVLVPGMVGAVGFPMLSSLQAGSDDKAFRKVFWANLALSLSLATLIAIPIALAAPWIMKSYGSGFAAGQPILLVLCAVALITATLNVAGQAITSEGKMWFAFLLNTIWAATLIGASLVLIPRWHALGMALAHLIAYSVHLITVSIYLYFRFRRIRPQPPHGMHPSSLNS